jgi:WD40 repeat protein
LCGEELSKILTRNGISFSGYSIKQNIIASMRTALNALTALALLLSLNSESLGANECVSLFIENYYVTRNNELNESDWNDRQTLRDTQLTANEEAGILRELAALKIASSLQASSYAGDLALSRTLYGQFKVLLSQARRHGLDLGQLREMELSQSEEHRLSQLKQVKRRTDAQDRERDLQPWNYATTLGNPTDRYVNGIYSPDGNLIVLLGVDQKSATLPAQIFDSNSGQLLTSLTGHTNRILSVQFSPDQTRIVTASDDKTARVWNTLNGSLIFELTGPKKSINLAMFSHDGKRILTASTDRTAQLWNAETGQLIKLMNGFSDWMPAAQFSHRGNLIATTSNDNTIDIWDGHTGVRLQKLRGHNDYIRSVNFSPDDHWLLTGSNDHTARIWDLGTANEPEISSPNDTFFGKLKTSAAKMFSARSVPLKDPTHTLSGHKNWVASANFFPDGKNILTTSVDNSILVWDANSGKLIRNLMPNGKLVQKAKFSQSGNRFLTVDAQSIAIWDSNSLVNLHRIDRSITAETITANSPAAIALINAHFLTAELRSDHHQILSISTDGKVHLWEQNTEQKSAEDE